MGSFGLVVASIVLLGVLCLMTFMLNETVLTSSYGLLRKYISVGEAVGREEIRIDGVSKPDGTTLYVNVTNSGRDEIEAVEIRYMDVMVKYESNGSVVSKWLTLDQDETSGEGWAVESVMLGGGEELFNPIASDLSRGCLDPGETMTLKLWVEDEITGSGQVLVVSPRGCKAYGVIG